MYTAVDDIHFAVSCPAYFAHDNLCCVIFVLAGTAAGAAISYTLSQGNDTGIIVLNCILGAFSGCCFMSRYIQNGHTYFNENAPHYFPRLFVNRPQTEIHEIEHMNAESRV